MNNSKQATLQLLKECIEINKKYKAIWFRTDSKTQVDKIIHAGGLFIGLYHAIYTDNIQAQQYLLLKYHDFDSYISLYDASDKENVTAKYQRIIAQL